MHRVEGGRPRVALAEAHELAQRRVEFTGVAERAGHGQGHAMAHPVGDRRPAARGEPVVVVLPCGHEAHRLAATLHQRAGALTVGGVQRHGVAEPQQEHHEHHNPEHQSGHLVDDHRGHRGRMHVQLARPDKPHRQVAVRQVAQQHAEGGRRGIRVTVEHAEREESTRSGQQRQADGTHAPADTRAAGQYREMAHIHGDGHNQHRRRQRGGDQQLQQSDPQFGVDRYDGAVKQRKHHAVDKREGYGQAVEYNAHACGQLAPVVQAPREDRQGGHQQDGPGPHAGHREMVMLRHRHAAILAHVVSTYVGQFLVADKAGQEEAEGGQRTVMRTGHERENRAEREDQLDRGD